MRVLVLTPVYPYPGSTVEGIFNEQHAQSLQQAGAKVTVVVCKQWLPETLTRHWKRYNFLTGLPDEESRDGIDIHYVRYLHIPNYWLVPLTVKSLAYSVVHRIREINKTFDIIQVHSSWPVGLAAPAIQKELGFPFVITLHIEDSLKLFRSNVRRGLYQKMFERAARIIAVGSPLKRFANRLMGDVIHNPVHIIPNGINVDEIMRIAEEISPTSSSWGNIVSVSSLVDVKGIDDNLRALAQLDERGLYDWQYTIVGDGPERSRLESMAQMLGIDDKVDFLGTLSHNDTIRIIAQADIFSLPSWQEAFGVVYLEAMACGKPVIGCRGQGAEDIIRHGVDGLLVKPRSVKDLVNALGHLLEKPPFARRLGEVATARAIEFTWGRNAAEYMRIYREISRSPAYQDVERGKHEPI